MPSTASLSEFDASGGSRRLTLAELVEAYLALFDGQSIRATGNVNCSYFDDPRYNQKLEAAARLSGPTRYRAYAELDVELARDAAPWAALANPTNRDLFSTRMGCEVYQPEYGVDLAALCVRR